MAKADKRKIFEDQWPEVTKAEREELRKSIKKAAKSGLFDVQMMKTT